MLFSDRIALPTRREVTDEGFLVVPAFIARPGIQLYTAAEVGFVDRDPNDVVSVFRPREEVFAKESLDSFSNKPITNEHPPDMVTAKNARQFSVGHSGPDIVEDQGLVKATLHVIDYNTVQDIEKGKVELSNGYTADIAFTPGTTPDGKSYDAIQRDIRGNHIAVVDKARGGPSLRLFDANLSPPPELKENTIMPVKVTIDGIDIEMSEQGQQAVAKLMKTISDMKNAQISQQAKYDADVAAEKSRTDDLQAKYDAVKEKVLDAAALDAKVAERASLIADATALMPELEWKGKSAEQIRKEIVTGKVKNLTNDSDSYIQARFDILVEDHKSDPNARLDAALTSSGTSTTDTDIADSVKSRKAFQEKQRNRWKGAKAS